MTEQTETADKTEKIDNLEQSQQEKLQKPVERKLDAKVYEARYRKIEERVKPPQARAAATTMSLFEIKRGLRGTWPKVPLILAGFLVFGFIIQMNTFLNTGPQDFWMGTEGAVVGPPGEQPEQTPGSPGIRTLISAMMTPMDGPGFIIIIHIAVISSGLIAGDLQDRAIDLYYSKISVKSYFVSKIVASIILTFIGMPLFALIFYIIAFYKRLPLIENLGDELSAMWEVAWQTSLTIIVVTVFLSVLVLVFSAYTSNPVNAGVGFLVFTLVARVFFEGILYEATNIDIFYALSPISALDVLRRAIIAPDDTSEQFLELSLITYSIYLILSLFLVWMKLYREKNQ